jgi:hypothetical protein
MNLRVSDTLIGQTEKRSAVVKEWKKYPGNFDLAAHAGHYYAKKHKREMVIVPGNSYMHKVYHIVETNEDLRKYVPGIGNMELNVGVVYPDGKVYQAIATK